MAQTLGHLRMHLGVRQRGQIIVAAPLALLFFLGIVGMVVDIGFFKLAESEMQNAADAAALAAVWYDPVCSASDSRCAPDNSALAAYSVAASYSAQYNGQLAASLCQSPLVVSPQLGNLNVPLVPAITVVIKCQAPLFGGSLFGLAPVEIWAAGTAAIGPNNGDGNITDMNGSGSGGNLIGRLVQQS